MNPWVGGIVVASLMAAVFGSLSGNTLGATALFMRDFYKPWFNPNAKHEVNASRLLSIVFGLLPIPFAMFMPELLKTTFFARALRTTLTVIAIGMFYLPYFNSGRGVFIALLASVVGTTAWYLAGNPLGIDNIYLSVLIPVVFLAIDHFFKRGGGAETKQPARASGISG
jgi:SSS family solute:Na+ symporter